MNAKNNQLTSAPFSRTYIFTASHYFASCIISLKSPRNDLSYFIKKKNSSNYKVHRYTKQILGDQKITVLIFLFL